MALRIAAPAKLNLFLHITGKRANGYHELESLAAFTEFGDALEFHEADELSLVIEGPFSRLLKNGGADNLVMRAARMLQQFGGIRQGAQIRLHKNIPVGAGLGGGSSDAAAALKGLMQLWGVQVSHEELAKLALSLGSDVPVCMAGICAWVSGIGEHVARVFVEAGPCWLVLVNPNIPLFTADVYRRFSGKLSAASAPVQELPSFDRLADYMRQRHNDLEAPAIALLPVIADIIAAIRVTAGCAVARMSGSGSTCFGLYQSAQEAANAVRTIQSTQPAWWVQQTTLLGP